MGRKGDQTSKGMLGTSSRGASASSSSEQNDDPEPKLLWDISGEWYHLYGFMIRYFRDDLKGDDAVVKSGSDELRFKRLREEENFYDLKILREPTNPSIQPYVTLRFKTENLYLVGFSIKKGKWYRLKGYCIGTDATELKFSGDYGSIEHPKLDQTLGLAQLQHAIRELEKVESYLPPNKDEPLRYPIQILVIMFSESGRFSFNCDGIAVDGRLIDHLVCNDWRLVSKAIEEASIASLESPVSVDEAKPDASLESPVSIDEAKPEPAKTIRLDESICSYFDHYFGSDQKIQRSIGIIKITNKCESSTKRPKPVIITRRKPRK